MTIRVGFRMVTPRTWMGGLNYLLNICRVLRTSSSDIRSEFFAPADLEHSVLNSIEEAVGAPPTLLCERTRKNDALAVFGVLDDATREVFAEKKIDLLFESTGYYGPDPPWPVLSWIPDFQHRRLPKMFSSGQWLIREARYRLILANRQHIIVSSEDARADLLELYGRPNGMVHVLPFAAALDYVPSFFDGERVRLKLGLPERFIFLPNQFWPHKNHALVVEALGVLGADAPCVVVSGSGDEPAKKLMRQLRDRSASLGVSGRLRILGHLSFTDVLSLNVRSDALLNPSLFEGWSTTVEEAKVLGTPMILSELSIFREQAGSNAIYFDPLNVYDCARALKEAAARPRRRAEEPAAIELRNVAARKLYSKRLTNVISTAFLDRKKE